MQRIPLEALGLSKKWPKLAKIQADLGDFQQREQKASASAATLRGQLPQARERDLAAEAEAARKGAKPPKPKHEPAVERDLEAAEREREVAARVVQAVHEDLGAFLAEHQAALFEDVVRAREGVAAKLAEHAGAAAAEFGRYQALARHVKDLRPAAPVDENAPAQRSVYAFAGVHTTRQTGPAPGDVEAMLAYLVSLGREEEGGANDAA